MERNIKHVDIELRFAIQNYLKENFDIAMSSLLKVLDSKPKHDLTLLLLGKIHEKVRGEYKEAHIFYERCTLLEARLREALLFEEEENHILAAARLQQVIGDYEKGIVKEVNMPSANDLFVNNYQKQNVSNVDSNTDSSNDTNSIIPRLKEMTINDCDIEKNLQKIAKSNESVVADAYYHFGRFYEEGLGVLKDEKKMIECYEKSGNASSFYNLGVHFEDIDVDRAIAYYEKAAALGNYDATYNLGVIFETKKNDEAKSLEYYHIAAKNGSADANYNLGVYYDKLKAMHKAKTFYERAIELESADAMYNLAILYEEGDLNEEFSSVAEIDHASLSAEERKSIEEKQFAKAMDLYMQAAKHEHPDALYNLGCIFDNGTHNMEQNHQKAFIYYQKASKYNHKDAIFNLGCMYRNGQGMENPDFKSALKFFKLAHILGHDRALVNIGTLIYSEEELEKIRQETMKK